MRGAPGVPGREEVRIRLDEASESRLVEGFESLERDQQGFASTHALLALIGGLGTPSRTKGRRALLGGALAILERRGDLPLRGRRREPAR
jgi:hypothetical protein